MGFREVSVVEVREVLRGWRVFTAEYKQKILTEYDALDEPGAKGALLRREGLYSSHLVEWRRARDAGAAAGLAGPARPAKRSPQEVENERLRARAERAEREMAKTRGAGRRGKSTRALGAALRERGHRQAVEAVITPAVAELAELTSTAKACALLGKPRASHYRASSRSCRGNAR